MTPGQFAPKPGVPEAPIRAGSSHQELGRSWGLAGRCSCRCREDEGAEDARAGQEWGGINHSRPQGAAALPALRREIFPAKPSSPSCSPGSSFGPGSSWSSVGTGREWQQCAGPRVVPPGWAVAGGRSRAVGAGGKERDKSSSHLLRAQPRAQPRGVRGQREGRS